MTYASVKLYPSCFDSIEYVVFAHKCCAGRYRLLSYGRVRGTDDANAEGSVDSMRKTEAITNCRAVLCSAEADGEVVFHGSGGLANFEGANIAIGGMALGNNLTSNAR